MSRAERNAVSPEVIGAAITPNMARMLPKEPSQPTVMSLTTTAALDSAKPSRWKKYVAAAAQMSATMPSHTIAP